MLRKLIWTTSALTLAMCVSAGTAEAASIGINFHAAADAANMVDGGETAGVVSQGNWNNFAVGGGSSLALVDDTGSATGVTLSFEGGGEYQGASSGPNAGDNSLMQSGLRSVTDGIGASFPRETPQILLEGLSSLFPGGYDVYVYTTDAQHAHEWGSGTVYEGPASDYVAGLTSPGSFPTGNQTDSAGYTINNGSYYSGTYTEGFQYVLFEDKSADSVSYTAWENSGEVSGGFNFAIVTGVQIVGTAPVPEPSTFALAGLGLVGLVGYGLRRRRK